MTDLVQLNLHEKAHGPHGLIAGTTGSGKSETIQSYILSLAVNFHPHDVGFLLIDYKGGGMAHLFKKLPHLLGTITNLDGAQSMRALVSINAELKRRQRLFNRYEVNHINQYQKKFKNGEAKEPLPHLFLISDEFAELKVNQPDFMKELVSTARVGRSLGVHLILATQKPSGVVDDQIWSNSRFKLALKVADRSDSMEMLHTPDAAEITQAGRAYLQVGNNEVYELFQSAWSGADYQPDKDELGIEDHTIYRINDLGQYEVLNQDLSGLDLADEIKEVPTELDAIVENIQLLAENQEIAPLPQPWLPPLRERMTLNELEAVDFHKEWNKKPSDLELLIGMADIPQAQKQEPVSINLSKDGNILLYGSPGTGKTTFLQSTAMDLARKYSPKDVTLYLMDFGTNGLAPLSHLPHVADTLLLDQTEKVAKFVRIMERELNRRKKLLSDYGVGTIDLYRQASGQEEPTIVILLDSYEAMKEEPFEAELFKILMRISREGLSIGVHLIMTAGRQSNLRATLYANFKHQMTLKQNDVGEVRTILGSTPLAATMEDIKGRILMKRDEVDVVQLALPVAGISDAQVINNLRAEVARIQEAWTGETPQAIPMVPEELTEKDFYSRTDVLKLLSQEIIPLGLDIETVKPMGWNLKQGSFVYVANSEEQMRTMTKQFSIVSSKINSNVYIIAPKYNLIPNLDGYTIVSDPENVKDFIEAVELLISERMEDQEKDLHTIIVIYDMSTLVGDLNHQLQDSLANIIKNGHKVGYPVFVETDNQLSKKIDYASKTVLRIKQGLVGLRLNDQYVIDVLSKPLREVALDEQIHYFVSHGQANKIKVLME